MNQKKPIQSLTIIGAGNLGWHLGLAFFSAGIEIVNIISRDKKKGDELASKTGAIAMESIEDIEKDPDLYIIAVQDKEISDVVERLSSRKTPLAHVSGSTGMEVFRQCNCPAGVLYPLQTFTRMTEMVYKDIPFLIEGSTQVFCERLHELAQRVTDVLIFANSEQRLRMHLAAVFACNFSNHMAAIAEQILKKDNFELNLIRPLMEQTFKKLSTMSPLSSQTGPALRGDKNTIQKHLEALEEYNVERELYSLISKQIKLYGEKGHE